ncbi:MAG: hypothetical protein Ta2E_03920 [Mycoplasmoidaceae bacterium]|nr:MAG: hypothetical protein Ta2E_03920 [Mycoplasmoidaceae bacterium]
MKNNLKENTKLRCNDSPRKKDIGKFFEFENIIDKEKGHKKMKQSVRQEKSNKAPGWFTEWVHENKEEEALFRKEVRNGFAKQEKFNANILVRLDKIEKDVHDIKKDVCILKEKVTVLEKDVHDIKEDVNNIVKKNKLKR